MEVASQREALPEEDVGDAMPGELEETVEEQSNLRSDWAAARAAMERAIGSVRNHVEEIARETMERRHEQRALEGEAQAVQQPVAGVLGEEVAAAAQEAAEAGQPPGGLDLNEEVEGNVEDDMDGAMEGQSIFLRFRNR